VLLHFKTALANSKSFKIRLNTFHVSVCNDGKSANDLVSADSVPLIALSVEECRHPTRIRATKFFHLFPVALIGLAASRFSPLPLLSLNFKLARRHSSGGD
jgi:hypothetical protein